MYLSYLLINTESAHAHPGPGRRWVQNPYRVHQRLWMAFPNNARKARDEQFLDPFVPEDFARVEGEARPRQDGFLFRVDRLAARSSNRQVITVQSALIPDWEYAFYNAREFLISFKRPELFEPRFAKGQHLRFRLLANPTKRLRSASSHRDGSPIERWHDASGNGRRVGLLTEPDQIRWLLRHAEAGGFSIPGKWIDAEDPETGKPIVFPNFRVDAIPEGTIRQLKEKSSAMTAVRFEGVLVVQDPERFRQTVFAGIGPGKAFGFGLLSVTSA